MRINLEYDIIKMTPPFCGKIGKVVGRGLIGKVVGRGLRNWLA